MIEQELGAEEVEDLSARGNLVASGEEIDYHYQVGVLEGEHYKIAIIAVSEVEDTLLVAVPEKGWHRKKASRILPVGALRKAVAVVVPACLSGDRETPEAEPSFRIWLGLLGAGLEESISYEQLDVGGVEQFPPGDDGAPKAPFAKALVAVARDHFTFMSADSTGAVAPGFDGPGQVEARLDGLEKGLAAIQEGLARLTKDETKPRAGAAGATAKAVGRPPIPHGIDPVVGQQALQAGVTPDALEDMAKVLGLPPGLGPGARVATPAPAVVVDTDEEEEEAELGPGLQNPVEQAVVQLSKLVTQMTKDKKKARDKTLEGILDRAEGGSAGSGELPSGGRSKAAALRSLRALLTKNPRLIYQALEARMQEDWNTMSSVPGVAGSSSISARGWLEHRSKIQGAYPSAIRAAWCLAGVWDCLQQNKIEEARARAALGVAQWDQQAVDKGQWLVAAEVGLEDGPPVSSFMGHRPLESWEAPHTRLIDGRWLELILAKLKDIADYQEKKQRLTAAGRRPEDLAALLRENPPKGGKGKKGKGKDPVPTDAGPPAPQQ